MSHNRTYHKFDTQAEAMDFAEAERNNKSPVEDKYVSGPFYIDEDFIFEDMPWAPWAKTGKNYWAVDIETYS